MRLSPRASFSYAVDPDARLALARSWGELTGEDLRVIVETVHGDPAWGPSFDAIWDCSHVTAHVVEPSEVPPVVAEAAEGQSGRDVLVESAGLAESLFSTMLALTLRAHGKEAHVVRSVDEALRALGFEALPETLDVSEPTV